MTALCNKLNIEKGSLTSMVDDLTKKGYVRRERDISDRRKYLITITERGEIIASDFVDKLKLSLEERLIKLTEEDQKKYIGALKTVEEIENICNRDHWYIGQEAVDAGIVDKIIDKKKQKKIRQVLNTPTFFVIL